jgi:hypothetical protein
LGDGFRPRGHSSRGTDEHLGRRQEASLCQFRRGDVPMASRELPADIAAGASLRGGEYGWPLDLFPHALERACARGYGCLGGEFQFRTPTGIYEMYWLSVEVDDRDPREAWDSFRERSCKETLERFEEKRRGTDFLAEARTGWGGSTDLFGSKSPLESLCFVADFVCEG